MPKLTLVSHDLCPYVQRAAIALTEKSVPFERIWIDLSDKPSWFTDVSPLGRVPVLVVEEEGRKETIFESAVILEYLEEALPAPLHPRPALARARHRAWMEFGSQVLNAIGRLYSAPDAETFAAAANTLTAMFERLETALAARPEGPYFAGPKLPLVDAVFGPVFRYFDAFDRIGEFGILGGKPLVAEWRKALAARPSVQQAAVPDYDDRLWNYLIRRRSHISALIARQAAPASPARQALPA